MNADATQQAPDFDQLRGALHQLLCEVRFVANLVSPIAPPQPLHMESEDLPVVLVGFAERLEAAIGRLPDAMRAVQEQDAVTVTVTLGYNDEPRR